jgi:hypothetical protein
MELLLHLLGNIVNFLLLFLAYASFLYLAFLGGVFAYDLRTERRFKLTPELWFLAAIACVYLLTCVTWKLLGF